jgi:SulP family sulfate permease
LASIETLLSAQVINRQIKPPSNYNSGLELIGQGLANLGSGMFGGMPVSGVVVRSTVNLQSGGRTKLASLVHALILYFFVLFLNHSIGRIPLSALAGLLCVIGVRLIEFEIFIQFVKNHRTSAFVFTISMFGTITDHLLIGLILSLCFHVFFSYFFRDKENNSSLTPLSAQTGIRAVVNQGQLSQDQPLHFQPDVRGLDWLMQIQERAFHSKSSFVHSHASIIGRVVLGDNVHIAPESSIRADEGTPFYIGANSNIQDGVVLHALKDRWIKRNGDKWAIFIGKNVSVAHQALVHGPCFIGDNSFVGFKAVVHDAIIGSHCYIGIGAVVIGVEIPDSRYVPHGAVIDTADKVEALKIVSDEQNRFNEDVVDVNRGLAAAYRKGQVANHSIMQNSQKLDSGVSPIYESKTIGRF